MLDWKTGLGAVREDEGDDWGFEFTYMICDGFGGIDSTERKSITKLST